MRVSVVQVWWPVVLFKKDRVSLKRLFLEQRFSLAHAECQQDMAAFKHHAVKAG